MEVWEAWVRIRLIILGKAKGMTMAYRCLMLTHPLQAPNAFRLQLSKPLARMSLGSQAHKDYTDGFISYSYIYLELYVV